MVRREVDEGFIRLGLKTQPAQQGPNLAGTPEHWREKQQTSSQKKTKADTFLYRLAKTTMTQ
jgi:hypothetical protein